jgi:hypothetical protein
MGVVFVTRRAKIMKTLWIKEWFISYAPPEPKHAQTFRSDVLARGPFASREEALSEIALIKLRDEFVYVTKAVFVGDDCEFLCVTYPLRCRCSVLQQALSTCADVPYLVGEVATVAAEDRSVPLFSPANRRKTAPIFHSLTSKWPVGVVPVCRTYSINNDVSSHLLVWQIARLFALRAAQMSSTKIGDA